MLIKDQKKSRLDISKYLLFLYEDDHKIFMHPVVTQDETDPSLWSWGEKATYAMEAQFKHPGSAPPKKFKRVSPVEKMMAYLVG